MQTRAVVLVANRINIGNHSFSAPVLKAMAEKDDRLYWNEKTLSLEMEIEINVDENSFLTGTIEESKTMIAEHKDQDQPFFKEAVKMLQRAGSVNPYIARQAQKQIREVAQNVFKAEIHSRTNYTQIYDNDCAADIGVPLKISLEHCRCGRYDIITKSFIETADIAIQKMKEMNVTRTGEIHLRLQPNNGKQSFDMLLLIPYDTVE